MYITIFIFLFFAFESLAKPVAFGKNFRVISQRLNFYTMAYQNAEELCAMELKKKCSPEVVISIAKLIRKDMENTFYQNFNPNEIEYLGNLFQHKLIDRVYNFRNSYIQNPNTIKKIQTHISYLNKNATPVIKK